VNQTQSLNPVYLIDASIYIFQAHFSPYVECYDQEGNELSAVYGFTQFLLQFLRRVQPSHMAVAHDESLFCGFRHELCPNYKSNRELPDENLEMQLNACAEICNILGLASYSSKMYEADDIIGTLANRVRGHQPHRDIHIISRDKDLAQLLHSDTDCLWDYVGNRKRYRVDIEKEYGVSPEQFPDYLGLTGDSVDCITGAPGVGPVKARELLRQFQTLENVYLNLDKIHALPLRGAKRLPQLLVEHRDLAQLSKVLATIVCEVDDPAEDFGKVNLESLQISTVDEAALQEFLVSHKFSQQDQERILSLAKRLTGQ
jgi:5'-3' exonuclease